MEKEKDKELEQEQTPEASEFSSLIVLDEEYPTLLTKKYVQRKPYEPVNQKKITAFIPGTVKKIFVKEGDKVKAGDKILILEAMKMDNEIITPIKGKVKKIYVKQGEMVTKNHLLAETM